MKVIIAGSRDFNDYERLKTELGYFSRVCNGLERIKT